MRGRTYAALLVLAAGCKHTLFAQDISPNLVNGNVQYNADTAGLTLALAGDDSVLYAVSLDAGVWKSLKGGPWVSLPGSPRWATSIAIDPLNSDHLIVGERNGDAQPEAVNRAGLWESFDAGASWKLIYHPFRQPGCRNAGSQAIPAVMFSPVGTIFIATACGIGRKEIFQTDFDFGQTPNTVAAVKAFSMSATAQNETLLWARADGASGGWAVLSSIDDGKTWSAAAIPAKVDGYGVGLSSRGDDFTIAAYDQTAVLGMRPRDDTSDSSVWKAGDNFNTVLYYFRRSNSWSAQKLVSGDGTGLGGRKAVRSFIRDLGGDKGPTGIGSNVRIFYIGGQDLLEAIGPEPRSGQLTWKTLAITRCAGCQATGDIHSDLWDVHVEPTSNTVRVASDGGVHKLDGSKWVTHNDGLHTHSVHTLSVLDTATNPRIAYVVTDNSEWWRDEKPYTPPFDSWQTYSATGDGSWTVGDVANSATAVIVRHANLSLVTEFGKGMPAGAGVGAGGRFVALCQPQGANPGPCFDFAPYGPQTFRVIQTLGGQTPEPLLDVVMIVQPPLLVLKNGVTTAITSGPLARVRNSLGGPILIRNRKFLANPDVNTSQWAGWKLVADDVPLGTMSVWVSNGHLNPWFYVVAVQNGTMMVFRRAPGQSGWTQLNGIGANVLNTGAVFGPIYVDPFDPNHVFVLAADGVRVSPPNQTVDGNTAFQLDTPLTQLVTRSGMYPLGLAFRGCNGNGVVACSQAGAFPKSVVGEIGFHAFNPHEVAVVSPVAGVFYAVDDKREWLAYGAHLPSPFTMPSAVGMDRSNVVVGFEGRGVWRFVFSGAAEYACYYERLAQGGDQVAKLHRSSGAVVPGVPVDTVTVRDGVETALRVTTDGSGTITVPGSPGAVVHLRFGGNQDLAVCETSLQR